MLHRLMKQGDQHSFRNKIFKMFFFTKKKKMVVETWNPDYHNSHHELPFKKRKIINEAINDVDIKMAYFLI